jgi:hypothetical protein
VGELFRTLCCVQCRDAVHGSMREGGRGRARAQTGDAEGGGLAESGSWIRQQPISRRVQESRASST